MSNLRNPYADETSFDDRLQAAFEQNILAALLEDVGSGDLTGKLVPEAPRAQARVIVREQAVLCGAPWFEGIMLAIDQDIAIDWQYAEGDVMTADSVVCTIEGSPRSAVRSARH
jgi:nicotinate-nucleotide pyrophosphorylase (carboxylating)